MLFSAMLNLDVDEESGEGGALVPSCNNEKEEGQVWHVKVCTRFAKSRRDANRVFNCST